MEAPELAILTEYCPKGSLNDVLQNDEIPLNWGFRFSFARDIARAMAYLHQRKINHGHLKSSNCIIDDRWVLKITGECTYMAAIPCLRDLLPICLVLFRLWTSHYAAGRWIDK